MGPTARLFVALWPDADARARLAAFRDAWRWPPGARPVADANLHVTLHFIGSYARDRIAALNERLAALPARTADLRAGDAAIWRGGIAVLTLRGDAAIAALHEDVGAALHALGVALDTRPYAPHVTLARRAGRAEPPRERPAFEWRASGFALVESLPGPPSRYVVVAASGGPEGYRAR